MKIYIHTDLEGAVGVDHIDMIFAGGKLTETAYPNLIWAINAAAEGACEAGGDTVTVLDSHGGGGGIDTALLLSLLHISMCLRDSFLGGQRPLCLGLAGAGRLADNRVCGSGA